MLNDILAAIPWGFLLAFTIGPVFFVLLETSIIKGFRAALFFYFGVFWRYLRNISVIDPNFWNENIYQITAFGHMVVMSIGIFANYNKLRKEKQIAESRADAEFKLREEQREFLSLVFLYTFASSNQRNALRH